MKRCEPTIPPLFFDALAKAMGRHDAEVCLRETRRGRHLMRSPQVRLGAGRQAVKHADEVKFEAK